MDVFTSCSVNGSHFKSIYLDFYCLDHHPGPSLQPCSSAVCEGRYCSNGLCVCFNGYTGATCTTRTSISPQFTSTRSNIHVLPVAHYVANVLVAMALVAFALMALQRCVMRGVWAGRETALRPTHARVHTDTPARLAKHVCVTQTLVNRVVFDITHLFLHCDARLATVAFWNCMMIVPATSNFKPCLPASM